MFPDINVTDQGHKFIGSYIGTKQGQDEYVSSLVDDWIKDVKALAEIGRSEPQLAYAAYIHGTSKRWNFICRTTPNVSEQMKRLEYHIRETLIPVIIGKNHITDQTREILSLPARLGGMGFLNPSSVATLEYECSIDATLQLIENIFNQSSVIKL